MIRTSPPLLPGRPALPEGIPSWPEAVERLGAAQAVSRSPGPFAVATPLPGDRAFLAVDRFAGETLCWRSDAQQLHWATRADDLGSTEIDVQALYDYLFFHVIPSPRTIFKGVNRLPAGHYGLWNGKQMEVGSYGRLNFQPQKAPSFDRLKAEFA